VTRVRYSQPMRRSLLSLLAVAAITVAGASAATLPGTKTKADRTAWRSLLHWPASCESDWRMPGVSTSLGGSGIDTYAANGGTLAIVNCYYGAYQGTFMLYLIDSAGKPTGPIALHIYEDPGNGKPKAVRQTMPLGDFVFSKGMLTIFDKAAGYGGCGVYSTFRLTGSTFVPVSARAKETCDAKPPHDPAKWPKLPTPSA